MIMIQTEQTGRYCLPATNSEKAELVIIHLDVRKHNMSLWRDDKYPCWRKCTIVWRTKGIGLNGKLQRVTLNHPNPTSWILFKSVFPNLFVVTFMVNTDYVATHLQAETDLEWLTSVLSLIFYSRLIRCQFFFSIKMTCRAHVQFYLLEMFFFFFFHFMKKCSAGNQSF